MSHYAQMLPRIVYCKRCGKKFVLRKRGMWFHCGTSVILLVKESVELHNGEQVK
jgi:hypothetical protein